VLVEINLFGLPLKTFGLAYALAFIACGALIARRLRELGKPSDWAWEMVLAAALGGMIGARGYFLLQNGANGSFSQTVFSGSGLIWYGGLVGGALAVAVWARYRGLLGLALLDLAAPALALGYAIGRIGCQLSGDGDYGKPSHLPWAMGYPHGTLPTPPGVHVQPTPVYETLAMGLVALWLWRRRDAYRPGVPFAGYLLLAGTERLLIEFIRRNSHILLGLTAAQIESVAMIVVGVVWLTLLRRSGSLRRRTSPPLGEPLPTT
jgi:phosphatidylglycerol---prolipoprotein diacylglyceryl transferase